MIFRAHWWAWSPQRSPILWPKSCRGLKSSSSEMMTLRR
jgi:hypothetical protein